MSLALLRGHASAFVTVIKNYLVVAFVNGGIDFYTESRRVGWQDVFEVR